MSKRVYHDGAAVEVWRAKRKEWVRGEVLGYEEREGTWKYFVQLAGYTAAEASDPSNWYAENELRESL